LGFDCTGSPAQGREMLKRLADYALVAGGVLRLSTGVAFCNSCWCYHKRGRGCDSWRLCRTLWITLALAVDNLRPGQLALWLLVSRRHAELRRANPLASSWLRAVARSWSER